MWRIADGREGGVVSGSDWPFIRVLSLATPGEHVKLQLKAPAPYCSSIHPSARQDPTHKHNILGQPLSRTRPFLQLPSSPIHHRRLARQPLPARPRSCRARGYTRLPRPDVEPSLSPSPIHHPHLPSSPRRHRDHAHNGGPGQPNAIPGRVPHVPARAMERLHHGSSRPPCRGRHLLHRGLGRA